MARGSGRVGHRGAPRSRDDGREPVGRLPRWAKVAIGGGLAAFGALVLARALPSPEFIGALFGIGLGVSVSIHAIAAGLLARIGPEGKAPPALAALAAAACALFGRAALHALLRLDDGARAIDPLAIGLAALAVTGAIAGLGWSAVALGARSSGRPPSWVESIVATVAATASLYSLGPLLLSLGVPVDHWTFLSLVAVAVACFGLVRAFSSSPRP